MHRSRTAPEDTPLRSLGNPGPDIACCFPEAKSNSVSGIDRASHALFEKSMSSTTNPVFLSVLRVGADDLRVPDIEMD